MVLPFQDVLIAFPPSGLESLPQNKQTVEDPATGSQAEPLGAPSWPWSPFLLGIRRDEMGSSKVPFTLIPKSEIPYGFPLYATEK